jgi:hypothetical protein
VEAIIAAFTLKTPVLETALLNECTWNPELLGSRAQRFIEGKDLSKLKDTWKRIAELNGYFSSLKFQNILCVTHSFFMQILFLYYSGKFKEWEDVTSEDIKNSFHSDYLRGFSVTI